MARVGVEVAVGYARPVMVGFEVEGWGWGVGGHGMVGWVGGWVLFYLLWFLPLDVLCHAPDRLYQDIKGLLR